MRPGGPGEHFDFCSQMALGSWAAGLDGGWLGMAWMKWVDECGVMG
jgi:hypothetical protein